MAIGIGVATIVGAIIAAAGSVTSGVMSSADAEDARNMALTLANIKRKDDLAAQRAAERLANLTLEQRKREAKMQAREARQTRKQREKEFQSGLREVQFNKTMSLINSNDTMRNNFANLFNRRK